MFINTPSHVAAGNVWPLLKNNKISTARRQEVMEKLYPRRKAEAIDKNINAKVVFRSNPCFCEIYGGLSAQYRAIKIRIIFYGLSYLFSQTRENCYQKFLIRQNFL